MNPKKDHTSYSFIITLIVVLLLLIISFVPPFDLGSIRFKRANIISDLVKFKDSVTVKAPREELDTSFLADLDTTIFTETEPKPKSTNYPQVSPDQLTENWQISSSSSGSNHLSDDSGSSVVTAQADQVGEFTPEAVSVVDYAPNNDNMSKLYEVLGRRKARIAVLGDSFIECDIIVSDLRETLQDAYGGSGVGFVPFSSPLSKYRNTVKHTFEGWTTHNVMQKKKAPEHLQDKFYISGMVCIPDQGATARFESTSVRKHLSESSVARMFFINHKNTQLEVIVNDSLKRTFNPISSDQVQQIVINADISSLDVKIKDADGFIGYGVLFEDKKGVTVDNYSIRGNSGLALFSTDYSVNKQVNEFLNYDLVVLQYGLNAMSLDANNYNSYSSQLVRLIAYVKKCFPRSAIMLMSVGDRCSSKDGVIKTLPNVHYMLDAQHSASEKGEVAIWDVFQAMGGENSMIKFVENKWAAKDYMHIGFGGGQIIGRQLANALINGSVLKKSKPEQTDTTKVAEEAINPMDSIQTPNIVDSTSQKAITTEPEIDSLNQSQIDTLQSSLVEDISTDDIIETDTLIEDQIIETSTQDDTTEEVSGKSRRESRREAKRNEKSNDR